MKKLYFSILMVILSITAFSQTYYVYTAKTSGMWTQASNWTSAVRTDGIKKNKVIIPANINIIADNDVDHLGLGNVQVQVLGILTMLPSTNLNFSENSSIELNNGTILGLLANQKIKIGNDIKYKGNVDGFVWGNFIADKTTGSSPSGFRSLAALPVNFTSFYLNRSGQDIQLIWSTDIEINNSHFDVERSFDGLAWQRIATVNGAGNSNNNHNYSYNDKNVAGSVVYYRLRQVDLDGRAVYSSIKTIRGNEAISSVRIYGSEKKVIIDLNESLKSNLVVTVLNTNGQVVNRQTFVNPQYKIMLSVNNFSAGAHIVHVTDNKGFTVTKKVIL